jgi:ACT domain-containing protein
LAVEPLRRLRADRVAQLGRGIEYRRATHHDRARMIGAVAVGHIRGAAVEDTADAIDRDFERIGGDLRENRLQALADRG